MRASVSTEAERGKRTKGVQPAKSSSRTSQVVVDWALKGAPQIYIAATGAGGPRACLAEMTEERGAHSERAR